MKLIQSKKANINYLAKIVKLTEFQPHPNPEVTRMKCARVDGYTICVGIDEAEGVYIYFPTSSTINPNLLAYCNLYRHNNLNSDPNKTGFFEDNGRVKAIKLKGQVSEGFLLPVNSLQEFLLDSVNISIDEIVPGTEFDAVEHDGKEIWINKKYIIERKYTGSSRPRVKEFKGISKLIEGQFRKHYETVQYRKDPLAIKPDDYIHISSKWDGTSQISAYVLCRQELNWKQKIAKWLTKEEFNKYDYLFSSRNVVQNEDTQSTGYYGEGDYTSRLAAHKIIEPFLIPGMTIYYEIVGYLNTGKPWMVRQGLPMDYGCIPPTHTEYIEGKNYKIYIYRITLTNIRGDVHEFSPLEVQTWCKNNNLRSCKEFYYGRAKDLYPELDPAQHWEENFMENLANDKNFYMEMNSPDCINPVPQEGIVIKKDDMISRAWKLKSFKFLNLEQKDLDKGVGNKEDES